MKLHHKMKRRLVKDYNIIRPLMFFKQVHHNPIPPQLPEVDDFIQRKAEADMRPPRNRLECEHMKKDVMLP